MTLFGIDTPLPGTFVHQRVDGLPVHQKSDQFIAAYIAEQRRHGDTTNIELVTHYMNYEWALFGKKTTAGIWDGSAVPGGGTTISRMIPNGPTLNYRFEGDVAPTYDGLVNNYGWEHSVTPLGRMPDWSAYRWQGYPWIGWDRVVVVVDPDAGVSYEFLACYGVQQYDLSVTKYTGQPGQKPPMKIVGPRHCGLISVVNLKSSDAPLTLGRSGRDLAPMGMGAGWACRAADTLRIQEVRDVIEGRSPGIDHYVHWTGWQSTDGTFVWPARGTDRHDQFNVGGPPHGAWARLKAGYPIDSLPPQARVIARGLKEHGMILLDSGGHGLTTEASPVPTSKSDLSAWQPDAIAAINGIPMSAFEFVDTSVLAAGRGPDDIASKDFWRV